MTKKLLITGLLVTVLALSWYFYHEALFLIFWSYLKRFALIDTPKKWLLSLLPLFLNPRIRVKLRTIIKTLKNSRIFWVIGAVLTLVVFLLGFYYLGGAILLVLFGGQKLDWFMGFIWRALKRAFFRTMVFLHLDEAWNWLMPLKFQKRFLRFRRRWARKIIRKRRKLSRKSKI